MDTTNFDKETILSEIDSIITKIEDENTDPEEKEKYLELLKMIKDLGADLKAKLSK